MKTSVLSILSGVALATSGMVLGSVNPASAAQLWNWSYSRFGTMGGSGTFTTNDGPLPYLITDITGTSEGNMITGLIAPGGLLGNDNLLTNLNPPLQLTSNGVSFSILNFSQGINIRSNLFSVGFPPRNYSLFNANSNGRNLVTFTATYVATIPEPSSLLGYITLGGLMLGGIVRKSRK